MRPQGSCREGRTKTSASAKKAGELGLVAEAGEADAFEGEFACAGFEAGALFTVADDEEVGERVGGNGAETGIGLEEVVGVLAGLELGGEEDDGAARSELQLGAELSGVGGGGALGEPRVVDGVGHEELRHAGAEVASPVVAVA